MWVPMTSYLELPLPIKLGSLLIDLCLQRPLLSLSVLNLTLHQVSKTNGLPFSKHVCVRTS